MDLTRGFHQAPISLCNYLMRLGAIECASAISALITHTETKYSKHVAAVPSDCAT